MSQDNWIPTTQLRFLRGSGPGLTRREKERYVLQQKWVRTDGHKLLGGEQLEEWRDVETVDAEQV